MPDQSATLSPPTTLSHLEEVQQLSHDLKRLVAGCETARLKDEVRQDIERLDQWTATYLAGLEAAQQITNMAGGTLAEARKELDLAYQQILTLEDEGGNVANPQQQRHTEALSKALRRVNNLIPAVAATISDPSQPQPEGQPEVTPPVENPSQPTPETPPETTPEVQPAIPPVTNPTI